MNKKYYITYHIIDGDPSIYSSSDFVVLKKINILNNKYLYLVECNNKICSLDDLLKNYNNINTNFSEMRRYECKLAVNMILEYKQILRNNKIKTLLNE